VTDAESLRLLGIREMASSFGGRITVQEMRGRGTTWWLEIPLGATPEVETSRS
jgi:hypothetical protein